MSSIGRIGSSGAVSSVENATDTTAPRVSRPINLHNTSTYDSSTSPTSQRDGLEVTDPGLISTYGRYATTVSILNDASDAVNQINADRMMEGQTLLPTMMPPMFSQSLQYYQEMSTQSPEKGALYSKISSPIASMMADPNAPTFDPTNLNSTGSQAWIGALTTVAQDQYNSTGTMPSEADITKVLQAGVAKADEDVANLAKTVHDHQLFKNAMQSTVVDIMDELRKRQDPNYQPQSIQVPVFDANGNFANQYQTISSTEDLNKAEADLNNRIQTFSDMSQMDQLNLQNAMQAQQRAYQTLSDIIKMMHDTAKAIIGNVRA